ncbi:serine-rich adhesin for platelets-like [Hydractinia symbiolongicarpus]|uniref:serine-rich adhesin for platelets-like n=1 Tax=Hydractinia symbiolongicarpus TaxID=13093 RepID=UPI00254C22D2|nr:serine-rich adhesin for platelets-like [Hydractinia symbiolongicarpus]
MAAPLEKDKSWFEREVQRLTCLLKLSERKRKRQKTIYEKNMESLEVKMMDFETSLRKEQREIQKLISRKDQQIRVREELTKALQHQLELQHCKQCGYPNSAKKFDLEWEINIGNDSDAVKKLPPLSLPVALNPPSVSFHKPFRPKSKLSPVAEESEVTFGSNLRHVHADLNPERFHAVLSASLQLIRNDDGTACRDAEGIVSPFLIPNNTAEKEMSTPNETNGTADKTFQSDIVNVDAKGNKTLVSSSTQTSFDDIVNKVTLATEKYTTVVEPVQFDNTRQKTELLNEFCNNLSYSTLKLVNKDMHDHLTIQIQQFINSDIKIATLSLFSDYLVTECINNAKLDLHTNNTKPVNDFSRTNTIEQKGNTQNLIAGNGNRHELENTVPSEKRNCVDSDSNKLLYDKPVNGENNVLKAIEKMVENVIPSVTNSNIVDLVKEGMKNVSTSSSASPKSEELREDLGNDEQLVSGKRKKKKKKKKKKRKSVCETVSESCDNDKTNIGQKAVPENLPDITKNYQVTSTCNDIVQTENTIEIVKNKLDTRVEKLKPTADETLESGSSSSPQTTSSSLGNTSSSSISIDSSSSFSQSEMSQMFPGLKSPEEDKFSLLVDESFNELEATQSSTCDRVSDVSSPPNNFTAHENENETVMSNTEDTLGESKNAETTSNETGNLDNRKTCNYETDNITGNVQEKNTPENILSESQTNERMETTNLEKLQDNESSVDTSVVDWVINKENSAEDFSTQVNIKDQFIELREIENPKESNVDWIVAVDKSIDKQQNAIIKLQTDPSEINANSSISNDNRQFECEDFVNVDVKDYEQSNVKDIAGTCTNIDTEAIRIDGNVENPSKEMAINQYNSNIEQSGTTLTMVENTGNDTILTETDNIELAEKSLSNEYEITTKL